MRPTAASGAPRRRDHQHPAGIREHDLGIGAPRGDYAGCAVSEPVRAPLLGPSAFLTWVKLTLPTDERRQFTPEFDP